MTRIVWRRQGGRWGSEAIF